MLNLVQDLVGEHGVDPARLTAVVTGASSPAGIVASLRERGLPGTAIITENELETGARRLIMQLASRSAADAPAVEADALTQ
jgi:hypothetical protein